LNLLDENFPGDQALILRVSACVGQLFGHPVFGCASDDLDQGGAACTGGRIAQLVRLAEQLPKSVLAK